MDLPTPQDLLDELERAQEHYRDAEDEIECADRRLASARLDIQVWREAEAVALADEAMG